MSQYLVNFHLFFGKYIYFWRRYGLQTWLEAQSLFTGLLLVKRHDFRWSQQWEELHNGFWE